jgi:hypothetical protein
MYLKKTFLKPGPRPSPARAVFVKRFLMVFVLFFRVHDATSGVIFPA